MVALRGQVCRLKALDVPTSDPGSDPAGLADDFMLTRHHPEPTVEFRYDGRGYRIAKISNAPAGGLSGFWNRTDYYYNENWQVLEERAINDQVEEPTAVADRPYTQYVWDSRYVDAPAVRLRDMTGDGDFIDSTDETLYYTTDANWNVTAVVDGHSGSPTEGQVLERYVYDPYLKPTVLDGGWQPVTGNASAYDNTRLGGGYLLDPENGNYWTDNRYLSTQFSFLSAEPAGVLCIANPENLRAPRRFSWGNAVSYCSSFGCGRRLRCGSFCRRFLVH